MENQNNVLLHRFVATFLITGNMIIFIYKSSTICPGRGPSNPFNDYNFQVETYFNTS